MYLYSAYIQKNIQGLTVKEMVPLSLETITQKKTRKASGGEREDRVGYIGAVAAAIQFDSQVVSWKGRVVDWEIL